jgi:prefoldin subunit 5
VHSVKALLQKIEELEREAMDRDQQLQQLSGQMNSMQMMHEERVRRRSSDSYASSYAEPQSPLGGGGGERTSRGLLDDFEATQPRTGSVTILPPSLGQQLVMRNEGEGNPLSPSSPLSPSFIAQLDMLQAEIAALKLSLEEARSELHAANQKHLWDIEQLKHAHEHETHRLKESSKEEVKALNAELVKLTMGLNALKEEHAVLRSVCDELQRSHNDLRVDRDIHLSSKESLEVRPSELNTWLPP